MPHRVQNPRAGSALQREYDLRGRVNPMIDEMIVPVAIVSNLARQAGLPLTRRVAAFRFMGAGGAGFYSDQRLETPPNVFLELRQLRATTDTSGVLRVHFGSTITAPTSSATQAFMDGRLRAQGATPAARLYADNTYGAQLTGSQLRFTLTAGTDLVLTGIDWPLGRTDAYDFLEFGHDTANASLQLSLVWDEYVPG